MELFAGSCRSAYAPGLNVTVDEHLCTFRGRCGFKVYIPSKPGKHGLKISMCCDSDNFYCSNLQVYCGKVGNAPEREQGKRVTLDLTSQLFGTGRNVTTDNFFTSVSLSQKLLQKSLTLVGTVHSKASQGSNTHVNHFTN
ncbi:piggyBac transposable element-derived protein 4-like [Hydra vulgaris]|uniref:piggyBac transposable element-derived protein 4-like n=1 Tax=Hydra vulgaris TaxID=6087 RepID=UPI001F5FE769|nr:piggyBac transposable element-derived protein 4-like [Hydra vulgaris]